MTLINPNLNLNPNLNPNLNQEILKSTGFVSPDVQSLFKTDHTDTIEPGDFAKKFGGKNFDAMLNRFYSENRLKNNENQKEYIASKHAVPFHLDTTSSIKALKAAVGTGKSSAVCVEIARLASLQYPDANGIRWFKALIVRGTHNELKTTTLKTWKHWFPPSICKITESPYVHGHMRMPLPDGTEVDLQLEFAALPDVASCSQLQGREFTVAWINEWPEIKQPIEVLEAIESRLYRYPSVDVAPIRWSGTIIDFNPSAIGGPVNKFFEKARIQDLDAEADNKPDKKSGITLYEYPPALLRIPDKHDPDSYSKADWVPNPDADYHRFNNIGYEYWMNMVKKFSSNEDYIRKNVEGDWTLGSGSKPCFNNFSRRDHAGQTTYDPHAPILLGADGSLKPAILFAQMLDGCLHVHRELIVDDVVTDELLDDFIIPLLNQHYSSNHQRTVYHDPGNNLRSANQQDSRYTPLASWRMRKFQVAHIPHAANRVKPRHDAVNSFLLRRGGIIIHPRCEFLIQAMSGQYQWNKPLGSTLSDLSGVKMAPVKNRHSDVADALQYLCLGLRNNNFNSAASIQDINKLWGDPVGDGEKFLWV